MSINELLPTLTTGDWEQAYRVKDEVEPGRLLVCRFYARRILSQLIGIPANALEVGDRHGGTPRIRGFSNHLKLSIERLFFSSSTCEEFSALAVAFGQEVGLEVEKLSRDLDFLHEAKANFTRDDVDALRALPQEVRPLAFYRLWTKKEALKKLNGTGLRQFRNGGIRKVPVTYLRSFEYDYDSEKLAGTVALRKPA